MPLQQPFCGGVVQAPRRLWIYSVIVLLLYGFFKELKPSEAFLTPYLTNSTGGKNFSVDDVNDNVYPFWTYSYLVSAFFVFLFTDAARYNPIILIESAAYISTRVLLVWGMNITAMQLMQIAYGVATATEVGYYAYIYAAVPPEYHEKLTGPVRAVVLFGRSISSFIGQILFTTGCLDYYGLNYFSMASVSVSAVFALMLPWYFRCSCKIDEDGDVVSSDLQGPPHSRVRTCGQWAKETIIKRFIGLVKFYLRPSLFKWSLWWAIAMCGVLQVGNYVQSLWKVILKESDDTGILGNRREWNGLVEGTTDLVAAGFALLASFLKVNWPVWGEITMGALSLVDAMVLLLASHTAIVWIAYGAHIIYRSSFAFVITIATSQIAVQLDREWYGLIFGFNTFMALVLQAILTGIVNTWLNLGTRTQFVIYGIYYYALTVIFLFAGVYKITKTGWIKSCRLCCTRRPQVVVTTNSLADSVQKYVTDDSATSDSEEDEDNEVKLHNGSKHYPVAKKLLHPV